MFIYFHKVLNFSMDRLALPLWPLGGPRVPIKKKTHFLWYISSFSKLDNPRSSLLFNGKEQFGVNTKKIDIRHKSEWDDRTVPLKGRNVVLTCLANIQAYGSHSFGNTGNKPLNFSTSQVSVLSSPFQRNLCFSSKRLKKATRHNLHTLQCPYPQL